MARDYQIVGETMVMVRFGDHILRGQLPNSTPVNPTRTAGGLVYELGITETAIRVTPNPFHDNLLVADFGPKVPADIIFNNVECTVNTNLVHFDTAILDVCTSEAWAGIGTVPGDVGTLLNWGESLMGAGSLLGNNIPPGFSGCHFVGLILAPSDAGNRYEFPGAFLSSPPYTYPLGTKRSIVECNWRCIPYNPTSGTTTSFSGGQFTITSTQEIVSSGATLLSRRKIL